MVLDILALFVMIVLIVVILVLAVWIGGAPGKIARQRNHPQAEAISVCGWIGLITLGPAWIVAIVWAFTRPRAAASGDDASQRIAALETEVQRLRTAAGGSTS
jgi:type VI protein secretion system component VasK